MARSKYVGILVLDAIRFAAAGVAKKDYVAALTHFRLKDGHITGFNGLMSLSTDLGVELAAVPNAVKFLAAVKACGEQTIALHITPAGKLAVRAGTFKAYVECIPEDVDAPCLEPSGDTVEISDTFLDGLKALAPIMGVDASRPWAMGIKLQSGSLFATNNVIVGQYWHGSELPMDVVIPAHAVNELIRIGDKPTKVQVAPNSITFWFGEHRRLTTVVLEGSLWPLDKIEGLLDKPATLVPIPPDFFPAIETLKPFIDDFGRVFVSAQGVATSLVEGEGAGVALDIPSITEPQAYSFKQLTVLGEVATDIDWTTYPYPCRFEKKGTPMRGVIIGLKR